MLLQARPLGYRFFTLYPSLYLSLYPTRQTKKGAVKLLCDITQDLMDSEIQFCILFFYVVQRCGLHPR